MPVELRTQRDGSFRKTWYGRYEVRGRVHCLNLGVRVAGIPPASGSLKDLGDLEFERSRLKAQFELDRIAGELRAKHGTEHLVERLYELKTGERIRAVRLSNLAREWFQIPRRRPLSARHAAQCQSLLSRFATFVQKRNPQADELAYVTRPMAQEFLEAEHQRGISGKTWNNGLKLLRATCRHLLPAGAINPFQNIPTRDAESVFRSAYTPEELKAIIETARDDDFIRPILLTGMCTAMRQGDCCLLQTGDVDLAHRFITVKTAKTGQTVNIPIFPLLYEELSAREVGSQRYMFPEQARMYLENPSGITWRVKKILAVALRRNTEKPFGHDAPPAVSPDEARQRGLDYIAGLSSGERKERMRTIFQHYLAGGRVAAVAAAAGVSVGSASNYLNEIEAKVGCRIVRGRSRGRSLTELIKTDSEVLNAQRLDTARRASIRDFHSFRVTWVTLALNAGVPLELVQKVTGHKTTEVVLKHYFQPGREAFRQALQSAMPSLLTNGEKSPKEELVEILDKMTATSWQAERDRARKLVAAL
jgi:integrase